MPVLEKSIEAAVRRYAEQGGCITYKMNGPGHRGWPDRMFMYDGKVLFIEFKRAGKEPTPLQAEIHDRLRRAGFDVFVIDNVALGKAVVEGLWTVGGAKDIRDYIGVSGDDMPNDVYSPPAYKRNTTNHRKHSRVTR